MCVYIPYYSVLKCLLCYGMVHDGYQDGLLFLLCKHLVYHLPNTFSFYLNDYIKQYKAFIKYLKI